MTIQNIIDRVSSVNLLALFVGCTEEFAKERQRQLQEIGSALCRENGLKIEQIGQLSCVTPLDVESERLFREFDKWLTSQGANE
jgi:hypothetical protein